MSKERLIGHLMVAATALGNDSLKELIVQAHLFGGENGPAWKAFMRRTRKAGLPDQSVPKAPHALFTLIATTELAEVAEKLTRDCFAGFAFRDNDFDNWLPATQPASEPCVITTLGFKKHWQFAEAAHALPGVEQTADIALLGRSLIENGYTMTLAQAEDMVERTKQGEPAGIRTDGWGNFFFVETGDEENPVSVGYVNRDSSRWVARVTRLSHVYHWDADYRLLLRNLDTSNL